jgi:SAM-dependent methyltransferase
MAPTQQTKLRSGDAPNQPDEVPTGDMQSPFPPAVETPTRPHVLVTWYIEACKRSPGFRKVSKLVMYQLMARFAPQRDWTFMNYGFTSLNGDPAPLDTLQPEEEPNRYCIQLYHHVVSAVPVEDRRLLEVGSGRGGGAHFIKRHLHPDEMVGVDFSREAVALCQRTYKVPGLRFVHGDAEDLPFDDASFDAVVNVESSHCYSSMDRFLSQVVRVLRPGGHFLFADFREAQEIPVLARQIADSGLEVVRYQDITRNIVAALDADQARKSAQIRAAAPRWLVGFFGEFSGAPGSRIHERFRTADEIYVSYALRKADA